MDDLISRESLSDKFIELHRSAKTLQDEFFLDGIEEYISDVPSEDYEKVVHAHWEEMSYTAGIQTHTWLQCSNCACEAPYNRVVKAGSECYVQAKSDHCPECGAYMDEVKE